MNNTHLTTEQHIHSTTPAHCHSHCNSTNNENKQEHSMSNEIFVVWLDGKLVNELVTNLPDQLIL